MKVFEMLRNDVALLPEQQIIDRLQHFDWKYEFGDDERQIQKGERELEILENLVYRVWKSNPDRALQIWNQNTPGKSAVPVTPSFIFRLEAQEPA
jgi:hypothetical protein